MCVCVCDPAVYSRELEPHQFEKFVRQKWAARRRKHGKGLPVDRALGGDAAQARKHRQHVQEPRRGGQERVSEPGQGWDRGEARQTAGTSAELAARPRASRLGRSSHWYGPGSFVLQSVVIFAMVLDEALVVSFGVLGSLHEWMDVIVKSKIKSESLEQFYRVCTIVCLLLCNFVW